MAKMNRLEFYGYRDQNKYNIYQDASYEINRRQDEAIDDLSDETEDLNDLVNAMKDNLIDVNSRMNGVEESVGELSESVQGMKDTVENMGDLIDNLNDELSDVQGQVAENTASISSLEESVAKNTSDIVTMDEKLSEILGNDYASSEEVEAKYAKKESIYTKEECDAKFLTTHQSLEDFYKKGEVDSMVSTLNEGIAGNTAQIADIKNNDIAALSAKDEELQGEIDRLGGDLSTLSDNVTSQATLLSQVKTEADENKGKIESLEGRTSAIEEQLGHMASDEDIDELRNTVASKADKSDLEAIQGVVSTKADKTYVDDEIAALAARESDEIDGLQEQIDALKEEDETITALIDEKYGVLDGAVNGLREALSQEVSSRESGDAALLGSEADTSDAKTIYGARAYSRAVGNDVLSEAKAYTDEKVGMLRNDVDAFKAEVTSQINAMATKDEVDEAKQAAIASSNRFAQEMLTAERNSIKNEILDGVDQKIAQLNIDDLRLHVTNLEASITALSTQIAALDSELKALEDEVHGQS